ncbi:MAG: MYXO-CTERM sorting domain-containing protein [Myxococcota bacterium]
MFVLLLSAALAAPTAPHLPSAASPASAPDRGPLAAPGAPESDELFRAFVAQGAEREPVALAGSGARLLDVYQAGDLAILHDADGEWFAEALTQGGDPLAWMLGSLEAAFYKKYEDDYQYLTVLLVKDFGIFAAFYSPMANDVRGIGYDSMFAGEEFDFTSNQLDGFIFMNYYGLWTESPDVGRYVFGQEFMHRWGSFVNIEKEGLDAEALLGRDTAHWSYFMSTPNSPMEGNTWLDNGDGTWTTENDGVSTYSDLDLYLMGLVGPDEVGPQSLLLVDEAEATAAGIEAASTPEYLNRYSGGNNVTLAGTPVSFTVDDIIAAEGARIPSVEDSPKDFRMAFLVLVLSEDTFGEAEIAEIDEVRRTWEADWEEDVGFRADLDTTLGNSTAPTWGEPVDGEDDTAVDTDTVDCCKTQVDEEPEGCGCTSTGGPGGLAVGALALVALLGARREARS